MATTIAVREETIVLLKQAQRKFKTESHDETIRALIKSTHHSLGHLRGALRGVKEEFKRDEFDRFA